MTTPPLVLIGLPGVGKSSVGSELASRLDRPFIDLDSTIEARTGRAITEIFDREGETRFRQFEHEALITALDGPDAPIVAAGGGIVVSEDNRRALADRSTVVWLDVPIPALLSRLTGDDSRPLLAGDTAERLRRLHRERLGLYTTTADAIVPDDGQRSPAAMADAVLAAVTSAVDHREARTEPVEFADGRS
ncbi:MAG: shikimate kinase, partial [Acidimicrobiia bacterium]|nr:shikimate kinase [Acidimicrobiia bacterium]